MTQAEQLAEFAVRARYEDLSDLARQQLKIRVLDSLGCAIGALDGEPIGAIREQLADFGGRERCTLVGDGQAAPDRAAFYNAALVRHLDFADAYVVRGQTAHPSDNLAPVLAAAEYAGRSGRDFLTALAVSYQVLCRLVDAAPIRAKGFDHTTHEAYSMAAGVSRALGLDRSRTANAIAICGTALVSLQVTRMGTLSNWEWLASANTAFGCTHATFLAMRGVTGPATVFEGARGFMQAIAGHFQIDWSRENLERVTKTLVRKHDAETHAQSTIDAVLDLRRDHGLNVDDLDRIEVETYDVAYNEIGGGQAGPRDAVQTREDAVHSLPYMVAAAILDGELTPAQYRPERIRRQDAQALLRKVAVRSSDALSQLFPDEIPCRVTVCLKNGRALTREKRTYEGFHRRAMPWQSVVDKFDRLSEPHADAALRRQIVDAVANLEAIRVADLTQLLAEVRQPARADGSCSS